MPARHVAVFGGLGFIGRHTVQAFLDHGDDVVVVDSHPEPPSLGPTQVISASLDDLDKYSEVLDRSEVVVCLAANSLPATANDDMASEITSHVRGTVALAQASANAGVSDFLFASSGGTVYGPFSDIGITEDSPVRPINAYGASKVAIEGYLRVLSHLTPMRTRSLRLSNPYGLGQDPSRKQGFVAVSINAALTGESLTIWGDGSAIRDYIHVSDVASAFVAASEYRDEHTEFNIGSGHGRSLIDVIHDVERAFETKIGLRFESGRSIDVPANTLNIDLAVAELGWAPERPMDLALKDIALAITPGE